ETLLVNSYHHQAIDEVAPGFKVCARALDGTVEGIESATPGDFILGVQWHPEMIPEDSVSQGIFKAFMGAVELRRGQCGAK
ncbi:MAG: gamma-glutamyl-gamma-aminobutyrate hydrolase family protein, partial [Clostridia bacterium]|nr:gamma-glutamyl-gamma-aminobutyrate hydrolase family protein [Clostridia bacterium]